MQRIAVQATITPIKTMNRIVNYALQEHTVQKVILLITVPKHHIVPNMEVLHAPYALPEQHPNSLELPVVLAKVQAFIPDPFQKSRTLCDTQ